jgi:hypothetical protein
MMGPRLALGPWWTRDHGAARPLRGLGGCRDSSKRERRRSSGFSSMTPLRGGAVEMDTRRRSKEGGWCCSDREMVLGERRRAWSLGEYGG